MNGKVKESILNFMKTRKWLSTVGVVLLIVIVIGVVATRFGADRISGFLRNAASSLRSPYSAKNGAQQAGSASSAGQAPLYKPVIDYERAVIEAVKRVSPAVVSITISKNLPTGNCDSQDPFSGLPPDFQQFFGNTQAAPCVPGPSELTEVGGGSGFIISPNGLILTNKHVVDDPTAEYTVFTTDGKKYDAKVLGRDPLQDLAVLKVEATNLPTVTLGDSSSLELGQTVVAIGNALGEFKNTVSVGVVSGLARSITAKGETGAAETIQGVIQTDAAINPGNSGGPMLDLRGNVIGISVAIVSGAQNIGFALPINWAKPDIETAKTGGKITAPYLGIRYIQLTPALAKANKLDSDYGALVEAVNGQAAVQTRSPAAKAGVKDGDIILAIDGEDLKEGRDLGTIIASKSVGQTIDLLIRRGGKDIHVSVTLAERPD